MKTTIYTAAIRRILSLVLIIASLLSVLPMEHVGATETGSEFTIEEFDTVDSRLDEHREKLLTYARIAYKNGDTELSDEIITALDEITYEETALRAELKELKAQSSRLEMSISS
ncbi:MAG: hypothetical protein LBD49_00375, partial [Oscillospiraceae bacterium]|nr:hypothetical protein [Oscillospiraceae bacterium]